MFCMFGEVVKLFEWCCGWWSKIWANKKLLWWFVLGPNLRCGSVVRDQTLYPEDIFVIVIVRLDAKNHCVGSCGES